MPFDPFLTTAEHRVSEFQHQGIKRVANFPIPAMTIFHELTHVWWIGPTNPVKGTPNNYGQNPPEIYGAYWNTKEASKCLKDNKNCNQNADSYANYAEVGYFQGKYGASLWPADGIWKKQISLPITPGKSQHTG